MRVSLFRWALATLLCGATCASVGCKSGASAPGGGWLSWGKKQDSSTALAATRPSTQLPPSPSATVGSSNALTANGAPSGYPSTGVGANGYVTAPAGSETQRAGYVTGPYGTNGPTASPYGATAGRTATAGGYGNPANNYGAGGAAAAPAGYGGSNSFGGSAPAGYGGAAGTPDQQGYSTADRRANSYPNTNAPSGGYAPNGASGGTNGGGYGGAAPAGNAPASDGYQPSGGYAPAGGYQPSGGFPPANGGYNPNSNSNGYQPAAPSAGGNYSPNGYAPQGGVAPANVPSNSFGGGGNGQFQAEQAHAETSDAAPSHVVPASPYASREGNYRPGSTGRSRPNQGAMNADQGGVRPASYSTDDNGYQPSGGSYPQ